MKKLYRMSEEEKKEYNFPTEDNYYFFKEEEEILGFAKINISPSPDIYIFILENKRGNGYGNELFIKVLENIKDNGIKSLEIIFPLKNTIMTRIVEKNGGLEATRKENVVKYTIII